MEKAAEVCIISTHTIRPTHNNNNSEVEVMNSTRRRRRRRRRRRIHLTPWDLRMISMDYIQKGILFSKPPSSHPYYHQLPLVVDRLMTSFSHAVTHFYPLAGRLSTTYHDDHTLSISLVCNNEGAEFVHASAPRVTVSDILTAQYIPRVVHSFFPLRQLINHDGHSHPLIGAQVTELADGIFIGCSLNHSVADGTSFWHFFNTWSTICRTGNNNAIEHPPLLDRWFPNPASCPVRLPFANHRQFIRRVNPPPVRECAFNFSPQSIKNLKTKANMEISDKNNNNINNVISSLQALLAHTWRAVTRARGLAPDQKTTYVVYVGYRSRLTPPLTQSYLGNATSGAPATELAGEMANKGLGCTAQLLNQAVAAKGEKEIREWVESWIESPSLVYLDGFKEVDLVTGSSPRFDVYGNDFGWGRPVAVRSGRGSKMNGKVTVYPGPEEGSMMLEVCLNEDALAVLVKDEEFMEVVG